MREHYLNWFVALNFKMNCADEQLKQKTLEYRQGNEEKRTKIVQLEKKIKDLGEEKRELEARLYPLGNLILMRTSN